MVVLRLARVREEEVKFRLGEALEAVNRDG